MSNNLETQVLKIGDLLVELGLVSQKDLNEALQIGKDTGLPIGRVLTMSAFLTESQFQAALKAQSLLKEGRIRMSAVKDAVRQVSGGIPVEEAFGNVGVAKEDAENAVKLGELLAKSGFVNPDQLESALEQTKTTGLPLGRLLLMSGTISESLLTAALNAQIFVRDGRITKEQAVEGLKGVKRRQVPIEVSLAEKGFYAMPNRPTIRLGELLVRANIISNVEVMNAIEIGLINDKQMGQILLELDRIDSNMLTYALNLQGQVEQGSMTPDAAIEGLMQAKQHGLPKVATASAPIPMAEPRIEPPSLVKFLKQVSRITDDNITSTLQVALKDNELMGRLLVQAEVLDKHSLQVANELRGKIETQSLTIDWANAAFQHCVNEQVSVDEALQVISLKHQAIMKRANETALQNAPAKASVLDASQSQTSLSPVQNVTQSQSSLPPVPPSIPAAPPPARTARATQSHPNGAVWDGVRKLGEESFNASSWGDAERRWTEAVKLAEPMGEGDPRYAYSLEKLGEVLLNQKRFDQAEPLMLRAHTLKLKILGPEHLSVAATLNSLSKLYYFQGKYEQAEPLARQFVRICEKNLGMEHADVACGIHNLATLYHMNSHYEQAEEQYKRALAICRKTLGNEHSTTVRLLKSYAALLKTLHREQEAEHLDAFVQGTITGSWKIVSINADQALHDTEEQDAVRR
jgi:hypothetical protein